MFKWGLTFVNLVLVFLSIAYRTSVENLLKVMAFHVTFQPGQEDCSSFHWTGYCCDLCHIQLHKPYINLSQQSKETSLFWKMTLACKLPSQVTYPSHPGLVSLSLWQSKTSVTSLFHQIFYHPDSGWWCGQPQLGSFFQLQREAEKKNPLKGGGA